MGIFDRLLPPRAAPAAPPASSAPRPRPHALNSRDRAPYDAAALQHQDLGDWFPFLGSPDLEINQYRDRIVARIRDLVRNDGWASGAVSSLLDQVVGGDLHLVPEPDWQFLSLHAPGFDAAWADDFARVAEALWRDWTNDIGHWCDASRALTMGGIFRLGFRHYLVDGDALAQAAWDRKRRKQGGYATCVRLIDPDRLSNPQQVFDLRYMRGGVEIDT
jgi:capsid protein